MAYEIIWEPHGVNIRLSGFVSAVEILQLVEAIQRSREVSYVINDFSDIAGHGLTAEAFDQLMGLYCGARTENTRCRIFFVTRDEALARLVINYSVDGPRVDHEVIIATTSGQVRHSLAAQPSRFRSKQKDGYQAYLARRTGRSPYLHVE